MFVCPCSNLGFYFDSFCVLLSTLCFLVACSTFGAWDVILHFHTVINSEFLSTSVVCISNFCFCLFMFKLFFLDSFCVLFAALLDSHVSDFFVLVVQACFSVFCSCMLLVQVLLY
jgi:hypothetical protein